MIQLLLFFQTAGSFDMSVVVVELDPAGALLNQTILGDGEPREQC